MNDPRRSIKAWQVMGENFELETKFKVVDYLGAGAYGMVCAVQNSDDGQIIAIKKCKKIFQSRTLDKRTLREMRLLRQFNHENIVKLRSILLPSDLRFYSDLYLTFEIMDTDLAQIIRSPQPLKEQHTQYFVYQLLRALEYLHSKNIVHRDIKPRNILVNADCTLKVADFGLARLYNSDGPESVVAITDYVTTRWYRAPEVIVGWSRYGSAIDMWAVGCIIAELISRTPLFPGENTMKQLGLIIRIMGAPNENFIMRSQKALFRQYMLTLMHKRAAQMSLLLPTASPDALDLIRRLLDYDPARRPGASLCLAHRFISGMSLSLSPPVCSPMHIAPEEFDFENRKPCIDDLRSEINFEIAYYNQDAVQVQVLSPGLTLLVPKVHTPPHMLRSSSAGMVSMGDVEGMEESEGEGENEDGMQDHEGGKFRGSDRGNGSAGEHSLTSAVPTLPTTLPTTLPATIPATAEHNRVSEPSDSRAHRVVIEEEEGSVAGSVAGSEAGSADHGAEEEMDMEATAKQPPTPLVQRLNQQSNQASDSNTTNSDTKHRTATYSYPTTAYYPNSKASTTRTAYNTTYPYSIPTTTSPHFSDSSSDANNHSNSSHSGELSTSVLQGMGMHLPSSDSGSGECKDERVQHTATNSANNTHTNRGSGVSGMKSSSMTSPRKMDPHNMHSAHDTYDTVQINSTSRGSGSRSRDNSVASMYAQDLHDVPSTGDISGKIAARTHLVTNLPTPHTTNTNTMATSVRPTHPTHPTTTTNTTNTLIAHQQQPSQQQQQYQKQQQRQQDEDAALVSSYFTCFCEHEQEQREERRQERRRGQESKARAKSSSGGSSVSGSYTHRYRATSLQEESKQAEEQEQTGEQGEQDYLTQQSRMEEGNSTQPYHAGKNKGYRPVGSSGVGTGTGSSGASCDSGVGVDGSGNTTSSGSGGRGRSDSGGRRKNWDSCVMM